MQAEVFKFISATFGISAAVAFAIIILALWLTYYITKKVTIINAKHEELVTDGEKMEGRLLKTLERNEENAQKKFEGMESKVDDIRKDIAFLKGFMESIQKNLTDGYTQRHSPISLTDKGKAEVLSSGLDKIVDSNWITICETLEKEVPSNNPYDIQTYCIETAYVTPEKFFSASDVSYIKELAFKNGLGLMTYTNMLAILIRDKYFSEKGINVEDVDKYDPARKS